MDTASSGKHHKQVEIRGEDGGQNPMNPTDQREWKHKKKKTHTQHMATCSAVATASVCSCVLCKSLEATLWCSHWGFSCQAVWWFGQKSTWIDDGGTHHCYTERSMSVPWRYRTLILQMMPAVSRALLPCWCCSNRIQMESVSNIVEKMICEQSCVPANKLHLLKCVLVFLKG